MSLSECDCDSGINCHEGCAVAHYEFKDTVISNADFEYAFQHGVFLLDLPIDEFEWWRSEAREWNGCIYFVRFELVDHCSGLKAKLHTMKKFMPGGLITDSRDFAFARQDHDLALLLKPTGGRRREVVHPGIYRARNLEWTRMNMEMTVSLTWHANANSNDEIVLMLLTRNKRTEETSSSGDTDGQGQI